MQSYPSPKHNNRFCNELKRTITLFYPSLELICYAGVPMTDFENCYINLFKENKNIYICPHCKYTFGLQHPEILLHDTLEEIQKRFSRTNPKNPSQELEVMRRADLALAYKRAF